MNLQLVEFKDCLNKGILRNECKILLEEGDFIPRNAQTLSKSNSIS